MKGKGRGYWGAGIQSEKKFYFDENGEVTSYDNNYNYLVCEPNVNILPHKIEGKKPIFYKLHLHVANPSHILINDEFIVEVDQEFKIDENDLPIHSLKFLDGFVRYYVNGAYRF